MFIHLHAHSYFSLLRGVSSPASLVRAAAADGASALALTDFAHLSGAVEFTQACRAANIRPIIGLELMVQHPVWGQGVLVFLVQNQQGWQNLCALSSLRLQDVDNLVEPVLPFEKLAGHNQGLLCLSGGQPQPAGSTGREWTHSGQPHLPGTNGGNLCRQPVY